MLLKIWPLPYLLILAYGPYPLLRLNERKVQTSAEITGFIQVLTRMTCIFYLYSYLWNLLSGTSLA